MNNDEQPGYLQALSGELLNIARESVTSGGVRVYVKTNYGPEVPLTGGTGPNLASILGIKAAVVVRDKRGNRIAGYGDYPATDVLKVSILFGSALALVWLAWRGLHRH